jgi:SAM-dependent methyltransferase
MQPLDDKSKPHYQGDQGRRYHELKRAIPEQAFPWIARFRAEKIEEHVRPGHTVLEYGVGLGWNLAALQCVRKIGLDVGEFLAPLVRQRGIEFVMDGAQLSPESVDVVVCHHTLEHVWVPTQTLAELHRLLRPRGTLLLYVPYEREQRFRHFNPREANHHLYSWNVQSLGNLVQDAGFSVQSAGLAPFGQERFAANLAVRFHLGESGFRTLRWLANTLKQEHEVRVVAMR